MKGNKEPTGFGASTYAWKKKSTMAATYLSPAIQSGLAERPPTQNPYRGIVQFLLLAPQARTGTGAAPTGRLASEVGVDGVVMPLILVQRHGCPATASRGSKKGALGGAQAARPRPRIAAPHAMMVSGFLLLLPPPPPPPPIYQSSGSAQARTPFPASIWESHHFSGLPLSPVSPKLRNPQARQVGYGFR